MTEAKPGVMRIGLLGGSFDPPHHAHLQLARQAQQALGLDQVRFIIAASSKWVPIPPRIPKQD